MAPNKINKIQARTNGRGIIPLGAAIYNTSAQLVGKRVTAVHIDVDKIQLVLEDGVELAVSIDQLKSLL